ncbi:hypothetical protein IT411_02345 [Candidatus Peregrinibacteria bacterium]|nr:hypothetical protein [Candidatus Peregrinibacteria bacterium]
MINNSDELRIVAFLKRFNCSKIESNTYIAALKLGTTTIQELARYLKRNRISVYYTVQKLIEKGFLFELRKSKRRFIAAEGPSILYKILEKRHGELKSIENDIEYVSGLLNSIPVTKHEVTVVKLYEETAGLKKMLEESLQAQSEIIVFSNTPIFPEIVTEEYYENYFSKKAALGINSRIIYPPCAFAEKLNSKKNQYKLDIRVLTQEQGSASGFYLWDNTLAIKSLKEDKRSCTIIENKDIANFFRENIFNHLWKEAKTIEEAKTTSL